MRARVRATLGLVAALAVAIPACGGGSGPADLEPVAVREDPAAVLANSEYPGLDPAGIVNHWAIATDAGGLTQVLSFVEGLSLDEEAARGVLTYFEELRLQVPLEVAADGAVLTFRVAPRNSPRRYVIIVPDGSPLPAWARDRGAGVSFTSTRPVNVDQVVTLVRLGATPLPAGEPFESLDAAGRLGIEFVRTACVRSTTINTDPSAATTYGGEIHNRGEGVICGVEARLLAARQLGISPERMAGAEADHRDRARTAGGLGLLHPPFDAARYRELPAFGPLFTLAPS